jgi:hypothetical protein
MANAPTGGRATTAEPSPVWLTDMTILRSKRPDPDKMAATRHSSAPAENLRFQLDDASGWGDDQTAKTELPRPLPDMSRSETGAVFVFLDPFVESRI